MTQSTELHFRAARREDVPAIIRLLSDDALGATRERYADPLPAAYYRAFETIEADPRQDVIVAESQGEIVGTLHLALLTHLTYQGGTRAQIEAVRVSRAQRGHDLGTRLLRWAIDEARRRGCHMIQLTTDKRRGDVTAFYEKLGFQATHEGMKLWLASASEGAA